MNTESQNPAIGKDNSCSWQLQTGDIVATNYGTGPYRVTRVLRNCRCIHYVDQINGRDIPQPMHIHITCVPSGGDIRDETGRERHHYLNGYAEVSPGVLRSVTDDDELYVVGEAKGIQLGLGL